MGLSLFRRSVFVWHMAFMAQGSEHCSATAIYLLAWKDTRRREVPGNVLWISEMDGSKR
jgi:hypothetical protein